MMKNRLILLIILTSIVASCKSAELPIKDNLTCRNLNSSSPILIDPESLQKLLLDNHIPLMLSANRVHKAKAALNIARAQLLPSINLGAIASSSIQPAFILSSVEFLLPFLLPMKWFEVKKAKHLLKAEESAYLITVLNQYASLLSMYFTLGLDFQVRNFMIQDYLDTVEMERLVSQAYETGQVTLIEWNQARIQTLQAQARFNQFQEILFQELGQFRYALTLCPEVELDWKHFSFSETETETLPLSKAVDFALDLAPESLQIDHLIQAARADKWSRFFSFFTNASVGNSITGAVPGENLSLAFENLTARGNLQLGFATFPTFKLSQRNIEELLIRKIELKVEIQKILDIAQSQLQSMNSRVDHQTRALRLQEERASMNRIRFQNGEVLYSELLSDQMLLRQLALDQLRAQTDVDLARLTIHRLLRTDIFKDVKGCDPCDSDFVKKKLGLSN